MNKLLIRAFFIIALFHGIELYPMAKLRANWARIYTPAAKEKLRANFAKLCTGVHWAIAAGPILSEVHARSIVTKLQDQAYSSPAPDTVREFYHHELQQAGIKDAQKVTIKMNSTIEELNATVLSSNEIWVGRDREKSCLEHLLKEKESKKREDLLREKKRIKALQKSFFIWDRDAVNQRLFKIDLQLNRLNEINVQLNSYRAIARHEAAHIRNNDPENIQRVAIAAPFITHGIFQGMLRLVKRAPITAPPTIGRSLLKVPGAIGKLLLSRIGCIMYSKYFEQRADDQIENDKEILTGLKSILEEHDKKNRLLMNADLDAALEKKLKMQGKPFAPDSISPALRERIYKLRCALEPHPADSVRIAKLQKRIDALNGQRSK